MVPRKKPQSQRAKWYLRRTGVGRRLTLWRVPWYTFPGFPNPTKSHGFRAPPSPAPAADEEAARQAEEEAGTHLGLARGSERSGEGMRDAEAPVSSRIAAAAAGTRLRAEHGTTFWEGRGTGRDSHIGLHSLGQLGQPR